MTDVVEIIRDLTPEIIEVIADPQPTVIEIAAPGPQGPKGDKGDKGDSGVPTYILTAGVNLGGHRVAAQSPINQQEVIYADATIAEHANLVIGLTLNAANAGDSIEVVFYGEVIEPTWAWTLGLPIFLATDGTLTQTAPTSGVADFSLVVGFPITPTKIFVNFREPIFLI